MEFIWKGVVVVVILCEAQTNVAYLRLGLTASARRCQKSCYYILALLVESTWKGVIFVVILHEARTYVAYLEPAASARRCQRGTITNSERGCCYFVVLEFPKLIDIILFTIIIITDLLSRVQSLLILLLH